MDSLGKEKFIIMMFYNINKINDELQLRKKGS